MTQNQYAKALEQFLLSRLKGKILSSLAKVAVWTTWPVIGPVVSYIVGKILEHAFDTAEMEFFIKYTDFRVDIEAKEFNQSVAELIAVQQLHDPVLVALWTEKRNKAFDKFVSLRSE